MITFMTWVAFVGLVAFTFFLFKAYVRTRTLSNRLIAVSSTDFFDACNSLLKAENELPDSILSVVVVMNKTAANPRGHWVLLRSIKEHKGAGGGIAQERNQEIEEDLKGMRKELQDLFEKAVVAWLNYLTHQNVYTMLRITLKMIKLRSSGIDQTRAEETAGMKFLNRMNNTNHGTC